MSAPPGGVPVARTQSTFAFTVQAPPRAAFPLFGALGERAWAGAEWQPRVLWPQPERDAAHAVFTVQRGQDQTIWVNTVFDAEAGRAQYVYVMPGVQAVSIEVALAEAGAGTRVTVTYRRTALAPEMNERVEALGRSDGEMGAEWEREIAAALAEGAAPTP